MPGVFKFKAIKPRKFNDAEIKRQLRNAVFRVGRAVKRDFESTVATWDDKPKFSLLTSVRKGSDIGFFVGTDDQVYKWVNDGTAEHIIPVGSAGFLAMPESYTAKTSPGVIGSSGGGESGDTSIVPVDVIHPGIQARAFDKVIAAKWEKRWKRAIEEAIHSGVAASGHKRR